MYMFRAYQSPCSGTHCGLQCAQMPNFASRNQSGQRYAFSDSQNGRNGPCGISPLKNGESPNAWATRDRASMDIPPARTDLRFIVIGPPFRKSRMELWVVFFSGPQDADRSTKRDYMNRVVFGKTVLALR